MGARVRVVAVGEMKSEDKTMGAREGEGGRFVNAVLTRSHYTTSCSSGTRRGQPVV